MIGVDYSFGRPTPAAIASRGYTFAVRYLSTPGNAKNLTLKEAAALNGAGVSCVLVFELSARRTLDGYNAGFADARSARDQADSCGAPADAIIYFAVDFDAIPSQFPRIAEYFRGAQAAIGAGRVAGYGEHDVGRYLLDRWCVIKWWQSFAWSGGRRLPDAAMFQRREQVAIDGVACDINDALTDEFGAWTVSPATRLLECARSEIGTTESPAGSNRQEFAAEVGHLNGYAWCQTFVNAMAKRAGVGIPDAVMKTAYTPHAVTAWKQAGQWRTAPRVGDFAYFQFDKDPQVDHVGIVEAIHPDGTVTCLEGNTSPTSSGSQSNGGGVYRRVRQRHLIVGYGRPDFTKEDDMPLSDADVDRIADEIMKRLADDTQTAGNRLKKAAHAAHHLHEHFELTD